MNQTNESLFGTVQKEILPDQVVDQILTLIRQQKLKPGDKLPPERELASTMQIGRQTLRAALRALAAIDVLEIRQGSGAYVTDLKPQKLIDRLRFFISLSERSITELFEARTVIELGVIQLAATRITDEQLAILEASEALQMPQDGPVQFIQHDLDFHQLIADAAQNTILKEFLDIFRAIRGNIRRETPVPVDVIPHIVQEHRQIVAALKVRDPQLAQVAMQQHLQSSEKFLRQVLAQNSVESLPITPR